VDKVLTVGGFRIEISDDCIGSAQCVALAPDVFHLDEDGLAALTDAVRDDASIERAKHAEDVCPTGAIRVGPAGEPDQEAK
jgi:ferredoxin